MRNQRPLPAELSGFCTQVALMLGSGLPLYDGMQALADAAKGSPDEEFFARLNMDVLETGSLYEALKRDGRWPGYMVQMTGIGERAGCLEKVMTGLAAFYDRENRIRDAVRSAVTYPLVLSVMMLAIVLVLIVKVLPVFKRVLGGMGISINESAGWLMRLGATTGWVVLIVVGLTVLMVLTVTVMMYTRHRSRAMGVLRQLFPPLARLSRKLSAARVASVMSMLLSGGFPLEEALEMLPGVLEDSDATEEVNRLREGVAEGCAFSQMLCESALFEPLHSRMLRMGAAAGREDQVLDVIARTCEEDVEAGVSRVVSIIEPTLVALLCLVIGAILMSVMMPMAGIISCII